MLPTTASIFSRAKLFRKLICAVAEVIAMFGVSRRLSLTVAGSSMNAALGAESGVVVEVTQSGAAPCALAATQPAGSAGAVTLSKFSDKAAGPPHGVAVGVGVGGTGVGVGVGVGVQAGHGVGVGPAGH